MKILILEDEQDSLHTIIGYLKFTTLEIVEQRHASSLLECRNLLKDYTPDLAFFDINLPDGDCFELLEEIGAENVNFKVIFVSAYGEYAIRAFRFNAVDFILKPINPLEFKDAIKKATSARTSPDLLQLQLSNLVNDLSQPSKKPEKIILADHSSINLVNLRDIIRCEADNNYTRFFLKDGDVLVISKTLKEYEELFSGYQFFRCHRSHLINLQEVKKYTKKEGGSVVMSDNTSLPISETKKEVFIQLISSI